jgi:hypothetical protein
VEWSIVAGAFSLFGLLYVVFIRVFPIVSFWEMDELAMEDAAKKAAAAALAGASASD